MASRHGRMTDLDPETRSILMDAQNSIEQGRAAGVQVEDTGKSSDPVPAMSLGSSPRMTGFTGNTPNASLEQMAMHTVNADKMSRAHPPKTRISHPVLPVGIGPQEGIGPQDFLDACLSTKPRVPPDSPETDIPDVTPVRITRQSFSGTQYESVAPDGSPIAEISWCPSHGKFYSSKVYGQPLRMLDLLTVEGMTDDNKMNSLGAILSRRIFGVPSDEILLADEVYFLQWLRASTYPDDIIRVPDFTCSHCNSKITDLDYGVNFKYLVFDTDHDPDEVFSLHKEYGYYPFRMSDGKEIRMFITRRVHDMATAEYMANRIGKNPAAKAKYTALSGISDEIVAPIANMAAFVEIDGCDGMDAKVTYFANLTGGDDIGILKKAMDVGQLRTNVKAKLICPRCHEVTEEKLPFSLAEYISGL